jgi:phospholipid/cholesterol/gamma-HCH transport system permease protein
MQASEGPLQLSGVCGCTGRWALATLQQGSALLAFVGQTAMAMRAWLTHPGTIRWRAIAFNIRTTGVDALPLVGLLAFSLGVVVAYQGADQLQHYGASIFVVDLVGLSMLREFAPLITALIIAGRSGSAFAAQIGTMLVTQEVDAMRTIGIDPHQMLVLPKFIALLVVVPLLTIYADVLGVAGGMVMAQPQLGVGYEEFLHRFPQTVSVTTLLTGLGKAPVFGAIVALVSCFQGFQAAGGADSVGRQTTRAVVATFFLVIVVDGLFSIAFSMLDL